MTKSNSPKVVLSLAFWIGPSRKNTTISRVRFSPAPWVKLRAQSTASSPTPDTPSRLLATKSRIVWSIRLCWLSLRNSAARSANLPTSSTRGTPNYSPSMRKSSLRRSSHQRNSLTQRARTLLRSADSSWRSTSTRSLARAVELSRSLCYK